MVAWIGKEEGRQKALEAARPSLILVSENLHAVREYCTWALSLRLPELVIELLDSSKPHLLTDDPQLHYLLAEAYRAHDKEVKAQEMALRARRLPAATAIRLGQLVRGNTNVYQIEQRINQAILLDERGMFDWEEEEYIEAIALSPNSAAGHRPRYLLAELYREGKRYDKAVDVMRIVAENIPPDSQLPLAEFDYPNLMASYHWYRSLSAQQKNQREEAMAEIRKACAFNIASRETNPDILINLHRIAKSNEDREFFREHFNKLVESYRHEVTREESQLAESTFTIRNSKLAKVCNQLAWLLASCETSVDEAIYLSERSLEFDPEVNTYLDTLARCYFAAGRYEDAVKSQLKALKGSPHNRAMKAQLEEFQLALENKSKLPKDNNGKD
jgi:tetratricopeptide (TPR) repeat protein